MPYKILAAGMFCAVIAGGIWAGTPKTPIVEACVVYPASGGYCILPGRDPGEDSEPIPPPTLAEPARFPRNPSAASPEGTPGKLLAIREKHIIGILPEADTSPVILSEAKNPGDPSAVPPDDTWAEYTEEEREMLACVIYCEAGGDGASDETRRMVGEVVLNRVSDPRFPNSIKEVLTQKSQYGRFHWTGIIWPERAAKEPEAVERAYRCADLVFTQERLLPGDVVFQAEFIQGEVAAQAPGFYFCK